MASGSISTAASALSRSPSASASAAASPQDRLLCLSFPRKKLLTSLKGGRTAACDGEAFVRKAQLSEIVGGSSNDGAAAFVSKKKSEEDKGAEELGKAAPLQEVDMTPEAISEFMDQVSDLVRLVDSKDVVELQLKQPGCEILIRKKEALPQQPSTMHAMAMPVPHSPHMAPPSPYSPPPLQQAASPSAPAPPPPAAEAPQQQQPSQSSLPPLKSPMAGTFYRSPAPGQPPFVKIGDKVRKGQILCIIEAMKMMNEIEADQDGTIVEILLEDAKPVGVGKPLFVIEP